MFRRALALLAFFAVASTVVLALPAAAQVQRAFPQNALRGDIVFGVAPAISLNGVATQLAPGSRIRDENNMQMVPSSVLGGRFLVHYTLDLYGLVKDVWILRTDEAARKPWPTTPEQARTWNFDPGLQVWTKP